MDKVQEEIEQMETTATSGGGAVTVTVTGKKEIKDIKILREKGEIRSNIDLKEIFSEKRYSEIERSIEFEGE